MTHSSLVGVNEPNRDRHKRHKKVVTLFVPPEVEFAPLPKRIRSYKHQCIKTLRDYRSYVSANDVGLHHRWKLAMDGMNLIPKEWDCENARLAMESGHLSVGNRLWRMYHYSCIFRDTIYIDLHNRCASMVNQFRRGDSWCWAEDCYLYLMITPDTFMLNISLKRHTDQGVF